MTSGLRCQSSTFSSRGTTMLLALLLSAPSLASEIITVDDDRQQEPNADFTTIQAAIDHASDGDVILVEEGTYTSEGESVIDFLGKAITVRSSGGAEETFIDGEEKRRGVTFENDESDTSVLDGFTIQNGSASNGGGLYSRNASPKIDNCKVLDNESSGFGGGMYSVVDAWEESKPTLNGCTFEGNSSGDRGGGLCIEGYSNGDLVFALTDCTFVNNSAKQGGGLRAKNGTLELYDCHFQLNKAIDTSGGGLRLASGARASLLECTFEGNTADAQGGGVYSTLSTLELTDCEFRDNTANDGGGMAISKTGSDGEFSIPNTLSECTFTNNHATNSGGGIYADYTSLTLDDCSFSGNSAVEGGGGGMANFDTYMSLTGCDFDSNKAHDDGGGMLNTVDNQLVITRPTLTRCTFTSNTASNGGGIANVYTSNKAPDLESCMFRCNSASVHGGAVYNQSPGNQEKNLLEDCTLIDNSAGDLGGGLYVVDGLLLKDSRVCGNSPNQIQGVEGDKGDWTDRGGNRINLDCCVADVNGDGAVNGADLTFVLAAWGEKGACVLEDLDGNGVVNGADLTLVLGNWGPCP